MKSNIQNIPFAKKISFWGLIGFFILTGMNATLANGNDDWTGNDPEVSTKNISTFQKKKYKKDATRLALRLLSKEKSFDQLNAEVPTELVESIYDALIAVHQSDLPAAKEVTETHKLHTFPIPTVDRLVVIYERGAPWATPLRLGDDVTDSKEINQLSSKYKLKIDRHVEWDDEHNSFNMRAQESLNIAPVAKNLSKVENVTLVDMMEPNGDGNDIEVKQLNNSWEIKYMVKFEGCITGCKKIHSWTFEVNKNGEVDFKGEGGEPLPKWMR